MSLFPRTVQAPVQGGSSICTLGSWQNGAPAGRSLRCDPLPLRPIPLSLGLLQAWEGPLAGCPAVWSGHDLDCPQDGSAPQGGCAGGLVPAGYWWPGH